MTIHLINVIFSGDQDTDSLHSDLLAMRAKIDRLKARETLRRVQIIKSVNEAQAAIGTDPIDLMKLHALLE